MRIRKHAARILPSLSIPAQSLSAAAAEAAAATAAAKAAVPELETHVCELNQSPWDAMAFTPSGAVALHHCQVPQEVPEEENGFVWGAMGSGQGEEEPAAAAAVSDISGRLSFRGYVKTEEMADAAVDDRHKREGKIESKKRNSSNTAKKVRRKCSSSCTVEAAEDEEKWKTETESSGSTGLLTCKKSDGKGWHCKREAQRPHSLCEYHLAQVRSYYNNSGSAAHIVPQQQPVRKMPGAVAALAQDKKNGKKNTMKKRDNGRNCHKGSSNGAAGRTRRSPTSEFYYYYSGFGPWRGKRRSGGDRELEAISNVVDPSDGDDEEGDGPCDAVSSPMVHNQAPDDLDDDDDDAVDALAEFGGGGVVAVKRRPGRKPIKARSLKSLL